MKKTIKLNISNRINNKTKTFLILSLVYLICFSFFEVVSASINVNYELLEPLPGVGTDNVVSNFGVYLSQMFKLAINIAAVLAVLQLSIGGFEYMSVETFTGKSDAKERIKNALYGLVLILASYLLLNTINPDLVNSDLIIPMVHTSSFEISEDNGWQDVVTRDDGTTIKKVPENEACSACPEGKRLERVNDLYCMCTPIKKENLDYMKNE